jgi:hypothetical protein
MSLISQQDRKLVINALYFYLDSDDDFTPQEKMEINALRNWVILEYNKKQPPQ